MVGRLVAANGVEVIARTARVTLNSPRKHRQRVIKIIQRLRLGINDYLARRVNPAPFFEEARRKFGRDAKACYRVTTALVKLALDAFARALLRRNQHEISELADGQRRRRIKRR